MAGVKTRDGMTMAEYDALDENFGIDDMAYLIRLSTNTVRDHAEELGGTLVDDEWVFTKSGFEKLFTYKKDEQNHMTDNDTVREYELQNGCIYYTTDYSIFKNYKENRNVDDERKDRIRQSILNSGYIPSPIIVNEEYYIIDGQGRREVAEELGIKLAYIVVPGIGMDACRDMNASTTPWTDWDYVESYYKKGVRSYKILVNLREDFKWATLSNVLMATTGLMRSNKSLRNGSMYLTEEHKVYATELLSFVALIRNEIDDPTTREDFGKIANVVMFAYQCEGVDKERLRYVVGRFADSIAKYRKVDDQLKELTKRYNKGASVKARMHFDTAYSDARIDNDSWYGRKWGWGDPESAEVRGTGTFYSSQERIDFGECF